MIHLLRLVDFNSNEDKIWSQIEKLKVLDSKRGQYYQDLSKNALPPYLYRLNHTESTFVICF